MPVFDFKCDSCGERVNDEYIPRMENPDPVRCPKCGAVMRKLMPNRIHAKIGASFDGRDVGTVVKEKNEKLKKKWAGYSYEQESLKEKINNAVQKKVDS